MQPRQFSVGKEYQLMSFQIFANAKVTSFVFSTKGKILANRLPFEIVEPKEKKYIRSEVDKAFLKYDAIIFFTAVSDAVRLISPMLEDKNNDPAIVVVDENSKYAVSLINSHKEIVNANLLATYVADLLNSVDVVTTPTELNSKISIDLFPNYRADGSLYEINKKLLDQETIYYEVDKHSSPPLKISKSRQFVKVSPAVKSQKESPMLMITSDPKFNADAANAPVVLRQKNLTMGLSLSSNANYKQLLAFIEKTFHKYGLSLKALKSINVSANRQDHPAIMELSHKLDVPVSYYTEEDLEWLNSRPGLASELSGALSAETLAIAEEQFHAKYIIDKTKSSGINLAVAQIAYKGSVNLIGIGPGDIAYLTPRAIDAIRNSDAVIGYNAYLNHIRNLTNTAQLIEDWSLGEETERVQSAIEFAKAGYTASLICSGDAGVYGLGSLFFESLDQAIKAGDTEDQFKDIDVVLIPGITASSSAASLLGAPLGSDFATLSLSDHITNKKTIKQHIDSCLTTDMAFAIYNPRASKNDELLKYFIDRVQTVRGPNTLVSMVRDAYRKKQYVNTIQISKLDINDIDANTILILGGIGTKQVLGYLYTPHAYGL